MCICHRLSVYSGKTGEITLFFLFASYFSVIKSQSPINILQTLWKVLMFQEKGTLFYSSCFWHLWWFQIDWHSHCKMKSHLLLLYFPREFDSSYLLCHINWVFALDWVLTYNRQIYERYYFLHLFPLQSNNAGKFQIYFRPLTLQWKVGRQTLFGNISLKPKKWVATTSLFSSDSLKNG